MGKRLRRLKLVLEYDGAGYSGFQRQGRRATVQGALEAALQRVTQEEISVVAAGRTDAGVHAVGQVVHLDTASQLDLATLQRALNAVLPMDISVRDVEEVDSGFHARYGAISRHYRYSILNVRVRSPLARQRTTHVATPLDVVAMQAGAVCLVGEHDFAAFGGKMWEGGTTRRTVHSLAVSRVEDLVQIDIAANAYLSRMVRSIAGCLIDVGLGAIAPAQVSEILAARNRALVKRLAPPQGLCLVKVDYTDSQLFVRSKG